MKMIDEYLSALRDALAGSDPAIIQDALFDAEEYLRGELEAEGGPQASTDAVASAIARYGEPAEVAAAYLDAERMRWSGPAPARTPAPSAPAAAPEVLYDTEPTRRRDPGTLGPFIGVVADPRAWASLFYMVLSLATGIFYFTWVVTGLSLSVGLAILIIGVPFILLFLASTRGISLMEGWIVEAMLGVRMPHRPRLATGKSGIVERIKYWLRDYRTWTTMLYMALMMPLGVLYFTLAITLLAVGLGFMVAPLAQVFFGLPMVQIGPASYYLEFWMFPFLMAVGCLILLLLLHLARGVGRLHGQMAKSLLVGRL